MPKCVRCSGKKTEPCKVCDATGTVSKAETLRRLAILDLARAHESEGDLELDDDELVVLSEGDSNGCYVQMWKWLDYSGTPLDKEPS